MDFIPKDISAEKPVTFKRGSIYKHEKGSVYIATLENKLIRLNGISPGVPYTTDKGFGGDEHKFTEIECQLVEI